MFLPLQAAHAHGIEAGPPPAVEQYMDRPVVNNQLKSAVMIPPNTQPIDTSVIATHDDSETAGSPLTPTSQSDLSGATKLKQMIQESPDMIVCPGVYDGFSARIALAVGFPAMYMVCLLFMVPHKYWLTFYQTGAGTTASRLGMADLGVAQLHDMREQAEMIANLDPSGPPLIADMDTGYGGSSCSYKLLMRMQTNPILYRPHHDRQLRLSIHPRQRRRLSHRGPNSKQTLRPSGRQTSRLRHRILFSHPRRQSRHRARSL